MALTAGFELYTGLLSSLAGERYSQPQGSYVREAWLNGIALQARSGFNPFRFGLSGASDYHSGVSAIEEDNLSAASGPMRTGTRGGTPLRRGVSCLLRWTISHDCRRCYPVSATSGEH